MKVIETSHICIGCICFGIIFTWLGLWFTVKHFNEIQIASREYIKPLSTVNLPKIQYENIPSWLKPVISKSKKIVIKDLD